MHHGLLGIHFDKSQGTKGLTVSSVDANSPAAMAGVHPGDHVVSVDGFSFPNPRQLKAFLHAQGGRPVAFVVDRNGQQQSIGVFAPPPQTESGWVGVLLDEGNAATPNGAVPNPPGSTPSESKTRGARISQVYPGGPGATAGLRAGDVITQVNGHEIPDAGEFVAEIHEMKPQAKVELAVQRGDQKVSVPVTLGDRSSIDRGQPTGYGEQNGLFPGNQPYAGTPMPQGFQGNFAPPFTMDAEQHRQLIQQNQRIEEELRQVKDELKQLRDQLQKK
jgi:S1-C subfamily serine protease